jgi:OOP family OmpA-OmpF porin
MKLKQIFATLLILGFGLVLTGCAGKSMGPADLACSNSNSNSMLKSGDYQKKIDSFLVIQDASSSMGEKDPLTSDYYRKLNESKDLVNCMNNSLPDNFDVNAGLRGFGPFYSEKGLIYGMAGYSKDGLGGAINSIGGTGGVTPMANALIHGAYDLLDNPGPKAVILFSDGVNTDAASPAAAAASMKEMHGNNICIYTVLIGDDPKGKANMEQIADAGKCGYATDSTVIGSAQGMDKFVTDVFLTKAARKPAPAPVMKKPAKKISMTLDFEFDFDKAEVRAEHHGDAKMIADSLNKYSEATAQLEGHTDSVGTDEYNMALSRRRAESVKAYVVEKFNIDASRISTLGYGDSMPVASNDTEAGRQRNRRVVAHIQ